MKPFLYMCLIFQRRWISSVADSTLNSENLKFGSNVITIMGKEYNRDNYTNLSPKIKSYIGKNIHNRKHHPLCLVKERIKNFFDDNFRGKSGNVIFSMYDNISPVVTVHENFDSLLVPETHPSRMKTDCYYINKDYMLRSHTTAHQAELILMGLDNFIVFGDVYRRDEIDSTHYPVFHQADAVYSLNNRQMNENYKTDVIIFEPDIKKSKQNDEKQLHHTIEATKIMEKHLKSTLESLVRNIFRPDVPLRWVPSVFPFTHPSWELELELNGEWTEVLGCGIMKHDIIKTAGAGNRIAWAFGIGLERLAMLLYKIPDIRIFWSEDSGFLSQFEGALPESVITFKPVSLHPQCINDISFWLAKDEEFSKNDFLEIVRNIGGDIVEQVKLIDEFVHPKTGLTSQCYRIIYRHMERALTQEEVTVVHNDIKESAIKKLHVTVR